MRNRLLLSITVALFMCVFAAAQETITLDLELYENGSLVGSPTVGLRDGETGSLHHPDTFDVTLTPFRLDDDSIAVRFEIQDGTRTLTPRLVIKQEQPATIKWTALDERRSKETMEVRVGMGSR